MIWILALSVIAPTVFAYLLVIKSMDRFEPEPFWLLAAAFTWGAVVSTLLAILGNAIGESALSAALGPGRGDAALLQASTASFVAPLVEETTKGLGLLVIWGMSALFLDEIDGALDGAIYGGVVGLGFTLTEDVLYVASAGSEGGAGAFFATFVLRTVVSGLGHASFTAMTGLGIGVAAESRSIGLKILAPLGGWSAAVGLHFLHNFLVTFLYAGGTGLLVKLLAFWVFDALFFVVIVTLALRDRAIVLRGLLEEAGRLLHPKELARTTSYWMLMPLWNFFTLSGGQSGYRRARRKQLDLIELSFLKQRRYQRGGSADLARREHELRARIHAANQAGTFIGLR